MPEGPEVWALSYALQKLGLKCQSYGKHLLYEEIDYSFGLTGALRIDRDLKITKINKGVIYGSQEKYNKFTNFAKVDWMNSTDNEIEQILNEWKDKKPKNKLINFLKDQSEICGLGVAWISEILHNCKIPVTTLIENIDETLIDSICNIRNEVKLLYQKEIDKLTTTDMLIGFVNKWCYHNLYKIRTMKVYKNPDAKEIKCCGRIFYQLL